MKHASSKGAHDHGSGSNPLLGIVQALRTQFNEEKAAKMPVTNQAQVRSSEPEGQSTRKPEDRHQTEDAAFDEEKATPETVRVYPLRMENFNEEWDGLFIAQVFEPYLSEVYKGLIARQSKDYLGLKRTKQYLNLPEILGERLVRQMNANGDERIDHDEFIKFMICLLMGSFEQKMLIAFKCYDVDGDERISQKETEIVLRNIPSISDQREQVFGVGKVDRSHLDALQEVQDDGFQIEILVQTIFD